MPSRLRRRAFAPLIALAMSAIVIAISIGLISALIHAFAQTFIGRIAGYFANNSFGTGSCATTSLLDGLPIETNALIGVESHMELTRGDRDLASHLIKTDAAGIFGQGTAAYKTVAGFKVAEISSVVDELGGQLPTEDEAWYVNQRWCYSSQCFMGKAIGSKAQYVRKKVIVTNPKNGRSVVGSVLEWGPSATQAKGRNAGISPEIAAYLDVDTDYRVTFGWAVDQSLPLGPIKPGTCKETTGATTEVKNGLTQTDRGFPLFLQDKGPWADKEYGNCNKTIGRSGCGPTALASVALFYQNSQNVQPTAKYQNKYGTSITPWTIAELSASNGHRPCNSGTSWAMYNDIGRRYLNLKADQVDTGDSGWAAVRNALKRRVPVIASVQGEPFKKTAGGHMIVLYAISDDGQTVYISDPIARVKQASVSQVRGGAKVYFIITPL